jgi:outer membrane receptor for ferric coprogen and ferric-rhodotorulic acid
VYQKDDRIPFWGLPSHEDGYLLDLDRSTFLGSSFGHFNTEYTMLSGEVTHDFQNGWTAKIMGNCFDQKIDEFDLMAVAPAYDMNGKTFVDLGLNVNQDRESGYNLDSSLSGSIDLFGREHKVVLGASYIRSNLKIDERWGYDGFPVDLFDPDPNLPVPGEADDGIQQDRDYLQYGLYGQINVSATNSPPFLL